MTPCRALAWAVLAGAPGYGCGLAFNNPLGIDSQAVSAAGLVLLLRMEEPAWNGTPGEVLDVSGLLNHGTASGALTTTPSGYFGRGGTFDGSGCVTVPDAPALRPTTALTYTAWVYPTVLGGAPGLIAKRIAFGNQSAYTAYIETGDRLFVDIDTEDDRFSANTVFTINQWRHVAVVFDGSLPSASRVSVYVDGALDIVAPETSATISAFTSDLQIGCLPGGGSNLNGRLDQIAIWHRALGASEIQALHQLTTPL